MAFKQTPENRVVVARVFTCRLHMLLHEIEIKEHQNTKHEGILGGRWRGIKKSEVRIESEFRHSLDFKHGWLMHGRESELLANT